LRLKQRKNWFVGYVMAKTRDNPTVSVVIPTYNFVGSNKLFDCSGWFGPGLTNFVVTAK
jgi:hypothetical protein